MKFYIKSLLLFCLTICFSKQAFSQAVDEERLKATMLYYIAEMVQWPDSIKDNSTFRVHLYDASEVFSNELKAIARNKTIHNSKIVVTEGVPDLANNDPHILFISKNKNQEVEPLHVKFAHRPILFVTNEYNDKWYVMINFLKKERDQTLKFEANTLNMLFTGMDHDEQLLEYGKSTFTIKETFRIGFNRTERIYNQLDSLERINLAFRESNKEYSQQIRKLQKEITTKNEALAITNDSLAYQIRLLEIHSNILNKQQSELEDLKSKLDSSNTQYAELIEQRNILADSISLSQNLLATLDKEIANREDLILNQNAELGEKESLIKAQTNSLLLIGGLGIAVIFITFLLYRTNQNKELFNQALIKVNEDLASANEELNTTNTKLADQKIELESTLTKLSDTQNMLVQSEKLASLGVFTSGIAHELNNPINYISAGSQALFESMDQINSLLLQTKPELADEVAIQKSLQESIEMGVNRTTAIVSSLRNYTHTSEEKNVPYNLSVCLKDALTLLHSTYKSHIEITSNLPESLIVECYPGKINQVFVNILNNGIQAMSHYTNENKGKLIVNYKKIKHGKAIQLSFTDTGSGISEDNMNKLFDPFFTTKEVGKGTGLGLYIVHGIINNHNGDIKYKSEVDKGTTVTITLPVTQS